jgi:hypothetical protein
MEGTHGNACSVLAQNRGCIVTNEHHVQQDIVIAYVGMVLVSEPIAGTNMKFDIANRLGFLSGEM